MKCPLLRTDGTLEAQKAADAMLNIQIRENFACPEFFCFLLKKTGGGQRTARGAQRGTHLKIENYVRAAFSFSEHSGISSSCVLVITEFPPFPFFKSNVPLAWGERGWQQDSDGNLPLEPVLTVVHRRVIFLLCKKVRRATDNNI